jgi:hypothetical protein
MSKIYLMQLGKSKELTFDVIIAFWSFKEHACSYFKTPTKTDFASKG